jgi:hypothetical protein
MRERRDTESHGPEPTSFTPASVSMAANISDGQQAGGRMSSMRGRFGTRNSRAPTVLARDRAIEKAALVDSAERIYLRYLLPGGEREIYLP